MKKILVLILISGLLFSCKNKKEEVKNKESVKSKKIDFIKKADNSEKYTINFDKSKVSKFTIVNIENSSSKAMVKNLSEYSTSELKKLPLFKRQVLIVIVPTEISKEELKNTLKYIVLKKTEEDNDIDEIIIFAYDNKKDIDNFYTFGKLIWAPKGELGNITPEIAENNIRDNYKIEITLKDKVGKIKAKDIPTKRELSIYYMYNDDKYLDYPEEKLDKIVMKKFNIKSQKELNKIIVKVQAYKFF